MSAPPPIPPTANAQPPAVPAPKQGMSGCAIAAIIGAVAVVLGVFVIAMLAAIAIPAYQSYLTKSRVVQGYQMALQFQGAVDEHREQTGACPDNAAIGLEDGEVFELGNNPDTATTAQAMMTVGALDSGNCGIEIAFANVSPEVDGKTQLLESAANGWTCDGGTLDAQYRTKQCLATHFINKTDSSP
jgi:type IV pilus assembly protein PilA